MDKKNHDMYCDKIIKIIGENIKKYRLSSSMSVTELSEILNVTPTQIYNYESGRRQQPLCSLVELSAVFGIPVELLFVNINSLNNEFFNSELIFSSHIRSPLFKSSSIDDISVLTKDEKYNRTINKFNFFY